MSLTKETLLHIESTEASKSINADLDEAGFAEMVRAVPQSIRFESLEPFSDNRFRFRGVYATSSVDDFMAVVNEKQVGDCFVDDKTMAATHIFNIGNKDNPGHCDHKAVLTLQKTAAFNALLKLNSVKSGQLEFADWLQEWSDFIVCRDEDGNDLPFPRTVAAIKSIDIKASKSVGNTVSNFGAERSDFEKIEAASTHTLPHGFIFECIPYESLQSRKFFLRLGVITSDKPQLFYRIERLEQHQEELAKEFRDLLKNGLSNLPVRIGVFTA